MAKLKTYAIDAIIGRGRTLTEAKADCMARVSNTLAQIHEGLKVIQFRDETWVCCPNVLGDWSYGRVCEQTHSGWRLLSSGYASREDCERHARRHLAQYTYQGGDDTESGEVISDDTDRREHLSWVRWQVGYADLRAQGKTDQEARNALF